MTGFRAVHHQACWAALLELADIGIKQLVDDFTISQTDFQPNRVSLPNGLAYGPNTKCKLTNLNAIV